ncbi:LruC domain-containing protein [Vibrio methylphosphonaticus]|uniref:LruC domain-containing protein n=1 Tax=Vibrio methylphosphonaticus TaxID=2946866 RepID=UPI00202AB2ED|nr:LruC domain-containing protein [Vibrio methylphosphonaticus]MCL9776245.1 LruC domain-containing protein [Vibrio methylphosphonaticus]
MQNPKQHTQLTSIVKLGVALAIATATSAHAAPFETCPSKAYLFQANPVQVYGVNLVTGSTALLQGDTGLNANINGVGFDFNGRYIYGYDTSNKQIVRLGEDFIAETVSTTGLPTSHTFYVGDVYEDVYYLYRKGKGLFTIDVSPLAADANATLVVNQVSTRAVVNLTDFAFHPSDGSLYGIDNNTGGLYSFDPATGQETYIGDTGELGTFGAGYFDVDGYYYVARNQDGQIYRIDLSPGNAANIAAGVVPAVKFADGPSSNQNDGARCANAPVIDEDSNIDFGDAPISYSTKLADNGPRHELDGVTWMGSDAPDGDQDGLSSGLADDEVGIDDENGVGFVTSVEPGLDSIVRVNASTSGYLSAWIDWNQDGDFADDGEQVFTDQLLESGNNDLILTAAVDAEIGSTWSRFRFSQQTGLSYSGGSTSGEVEDHSLTVTGEGISVRYYPNATGYTTVAYEDNWPYTADYDMNDVVVRYRITEILRDGAVVKSKIDGYLGAVGASYHNGFALRLKGVNRSDIDATTTRQIHNGSQRESSGLEDISNEAIFVISEDTSVYKVEGCDYHRTLASCAQQEDVQLNFTLHVNFLDGSDTSSLMSMPYDPFIFATPGYYHGEGYFQPGRAWEVHLPNYEPTEQFNAQLFAGLGVDVSDSNSGVYYKTSGNLPWALMINDEWEWPIERTDLVVAYPQFATYAESAGDQAKNWFESQYATPGKCYVP